MVGADGYAALVQQSAQIAKLYEISEESVIHLLNRHGSLISEVLEIITHNPKMSERIDPALPYLKAEIEYAASHEGARSVDDVISRRTRLSFEAINHGVHLADEVASLIAPVLGWSAKERKESIAQYIELVEREIVALDELIEVSS
jgi:glycerol-3-phosphate dehydrogenase